MDVDRHLVGQRVVHLVDVAQPWGHRLDLAGRQQRGLALRHQPALGVKAEGLRHLLASQQADQAPDGVVMHRRALARAPAEADHREALQRVGMQQVLAVELRVGLGHLGRQPVIARDQRLQFTARGRQQCRLGQGLRDQPGDLGDEVSQG